MQEDQQLAVRERLDAEVEDLKSKLVEAQARIQPLSDAAQEALDTFFGKDLDDAIDPAAEKAYDRAQHAFERGLDNVAFLKSKIELLQSEEEFDRRCNVQTRVVTARKARMAKKETAKDQGVPEIYLAESGNFKPGLDARYKSDLINSALGEKGKGQLAEFDAKDAIKRLQQRNWISFLERKKEIIKEKEAKAAKAKAEKDEKAREAAAAKAVKAAQDKAAKEKVAA